MGTQANEPCGIQQASGTEAHAMKRRWNEAIQALVLIRLGQDLGTNTPAARALHDLLELIASIPLNLF